MKVIILRGISGSGKTTLGREFAKLIDTEVFSADDYFTDPETGEYHYDRTKQQAAHNACLMSFVSAVSSLAWNKLLIVDNTNTRAVEIAPYYQLALTYEWPVRIITILCDPVLAWEMNQHNVPLEAIIAQDRRIRNEALPPWWRETIVPRIYMVSGTDPDGNVTHDDGLIFSPTDWLEKLR